MIKYGFKLQNGGGNTISGGEFLTFDELREYAIDYADKSMANSEERQRFMVWLEQLKTPDRGLFSYGKTYRGSAGLNFTVDAFSDESK